MLFCPNCGKKMNIVLEFDKNNIYNFYKCNECNYNTSNKKIKITKKMLDQQIKNFLST